MILPEHIPANPQHQRFADAHLAGANIADAYLAAGYKCNRHSASHAGKRLLKSKAVQTYIAHLQQAAASDSLLTILEIRHFLARIVRKPITALSLDTDTDADLIKSYATNTTEVSENVRLEKLDPLKAIEIDLKLSGNDPEQSNLRTLAAAIASLAAVHPLPDDRM